MTERQQVLEALLVAQQPLSEIAARLAKFSWDSSELVWLKREHLVAVLRRFIDGNLRAEDVCAWADLVELRDDIGFEPEHGELLQASIFQLATPETAGALDSSIASALIAKLQA